MLQKPFKKIRDAKGKLIRDAQGRYRYLIRFRMGGRETREIKRRIFLKDDLEAAKAVAEMRGELEPDGERYTWDMAYKLYREDKTHLTDDYVTRVGNAVNYIRDHCGPFIEKTSHAAYTAAIRARAAKTSGRTANNTRIYTLSVARFARGEGMIRKIPFENSPARPEKRTGRKPFPIGLLPDYYEALDAYTQPMFLALLTSGERVSAICGLKISDLDYERRCATVIKKGGKEREIPLSEMFIRAIDAGLALEPENGERQEEGIVFITRMGTTWNRFTFYRRATEAWKAAGLETYTIHSLRNLIASELADVDANRHTISASLGHENTATADIYVKAREKLRAASSGLGTWGDMLKHALGDSLGRTLAAPNSEKPKDGVKCKKTKNPRNSESYGG